MKRARLFQSIAAIFLTTGISQSYALDVDAGDYTALPAGTNLGLVYHQTVNFGSAYANGNKIPANLRANANLGVVRMVHFTEFAGYTIDPQFWIPFGSIKTKDAATALGNESGVGDITLGGTIWLVNKPKEQTYFGLSTFLTAPTGSYEQNKAINELAENRYKLVLQGGYITPIADKVLLDLVGDVTVFGKNTEYLGNNTLKQDPRYQLQAHFRYQATPTWDWRMGISKTFGGDVKVNGVQTGGVKGSEVTKISFGTAAFVSPTVQLLATVGKDLSINDAFKESSRLNLRLLKVF